MKIFIDFDDVTFNTKKFREDLSQIFSLYGISKEEYENSYFDPSDKRAIKTHNQDEQIERLRKKLSFDEKGLRQSLEEFMQNSCQYIFADVFPFVDLHKEDELFVLSFGSKVFQEKKIRNSKMQNCIPNILITEKDKAEALGDVLKNNDLKEKMFFLDDRVEQIAAVKNKFPEVITILIKRPEGRYQEMMKNEFCDFEAHNLEEAEKIIQEKCLI